jgi:hypothetical protein
MSIIPNIENMTDAEKLAVLESVQKSIAESKEIQKKKIGENVNLVISALKKIESDIQARYDAIGTTIENRVASIKDGKDGKDGRDGVNGRDGKAGRDGAKGDKGNAGLNGKDGVDGRDGVSVTDAKIDFDGSLVITLSTGQEINVGEVVSSDIAEKIKVINTMSTNAAIAVKEEGSTLTNGVKSINFVGTGITATTSGDDVTVTVASGSGTVTSVAATGGTGISVTGSPITTSGTLTITNTAPDQTVALTDGTGITTSGTYPNFTITNSGVTSAVAGTGISVSGATGAVTITNSAPDQTVSLTDGTGISTSGTYPNFTITNSAPDQTVALTQGGTTTITGTYPSFTISSADQFQGTVTSVTGTSPVASSGGATPAISLSAGYGDTLNPYASKTANYVLAAPDGTAGVPTFRAVVAADIPTLNQNTTGSAATLTTGRTVAITGDLAYTSPSFNGSANVTAAGTLATVNANVGSFTNASVTVNAKGLVTAVSNGTAGGTVTSVAATVPSFLSISGSPITTSGTLAIGLSGTALPVANGGTGVTTSTGSGAVVLGTSPTLTTPTINSAQVATVSGTAPLYMARAWVNFNGTGTVAIKASGNVTSISDNGTGSYAINLTTAMPDVNYACVMATRGSAGAGTPFLPVEHASLAARTTSSIAFYVISLGGATPDADTVEVVFFR